MPENKTDNFLKAIKKYAKAQKKSMRYEVNQLKTERLKEAEEKGKKDKDALIREKLTEKHNSMTAQLAKKTQEGQKKLYIERSAMTDEVFKLAAEKLIAFTHSDKYEPMLFDGAKAVAELFGENDCVVYVKDSDMSYGDKIKSFFGGNAEVAADETIKIGGVKGFCKSMGIIADETLDSKLEEQRGWFVENAELSVL